MQNPKNNNDITVVVTAYNRTQFLQECLYSLLGQSLTDFEVILVTNFEYDLRSFPFKKIDHVIMNGTIGEFLVAALQRASGNFVCFLDDDDLFKLEKLIQVKKLFQDDSIVYIHNDAVILRDKSKHSRFFYPPDFNMSCISVRKSIINENFMHLKSLITGPDTFFYALALCTGGKIKISGQKLTIYRVHRESTSISGNNRIWLDADFKMLNFFYSVFICKKSKNYLNKLKVAIELKLFIYFDEESVFAYGLRNTFIIWLYLFYKIASEHNSSDIINLIRHFVRYIRIRLSLHIKSKV